jgi:hypothetical protein
MYTPSFGAHASEIPTSFARIGSWEFVSVSTAIRGALRAAATAASSSARVRIVR